MLVVEIAGAGAYVGEAVFGGDYALRGAASLDVDAPVGVLLLVGLGEFSAKGATEVEPTTLSARPVCEPEQPATG